MKTRKIIYALTLLVFSSLSHAEASLESESVIAAKSRIEELRVSMINSQVELDKLKSELAALHRAGDAEFFRIKLDKQEIFDIDNFRFLPIIENPKKLQEAIIQNNKTSKPQETNFPFSLFIIAVTTYFSLGLFIDKYVLARAKKQGENTENV